jgi:hypothetical protein
MNLCPYKYILGVPKKGVHKYRFLGVAVVDTLMTIIGSLVLSYIFNWNFLITFITFFIVGEILHYIFCVPTAIMLFLFPSIFFND